MVVETRNTLLRRLTVGSTDFNFVSRCSSLCGFVNCGIGIGFVLDEFKNKNYPNLKSINLEEQISTNIYIATNKSLKPTFAANKFIEELKKATNR